MCVEGEGAREGNVLPRLGSVKCRECEGGGWWIGHVWKELGVASHTLEAAEVTPWRPLRSPPRGHSS